jgi:hypothetical protein
MQPQNKKSPEIIILSLKTTDFKGKYSYCIEYSLKIC